MSTTHISLMGKGGVGKSFIAAMITQYLQGRGVSPYCADTDPTNATFAGYPSFNAEHINIADAAMQIDKRQFDKLIERIVAHPGDCVVDTGGSAFLPMMAYVKENEVVEFLKGHGKDVIIHTPLIAGQGMVETIRGLESILKHVPAPVVVWQNELYGEVINDGKTFAQSELYKKYKDRVLGIVTIAKRGGDAYIQDIHKMTTKKLTFEQAIASNDFALMERQRFTIVRREVFAQLDSIPLGCDGTAAKAA